MRAAFSTSFRFVALSTAVAVAASVFLAAAPASADTAPPDPGTPVTMAADALPTVQIDGVVWSQAIVGNTVYVGGEFTTARPADAAPGVGTVPRANLLAYNLTTGALISSWNPGTNAPVKAVVASPDGTRIYIGGNFTSAGGQNRYRLAAFDTATGALVSPWNPGTNTRVTSLAVTSTTLYVGGAFSSASNETRNRLAAYSTSTLALLPWAANVDNGGVEALTAKADGSQVVVGGSFTSINGSSNPGYGLASLHGTSGALLPWAANSKVRNGTSQGAILGLTSDDKSVYGVGYTFGRAGGTLEGTFKASWNGGTLEWVEDCHGDTYSAVPVGDVVYTTAHAHYCGNTPGGFPQTEPWTFYRALAFTNYPDGVSSKEPHGYTNWEGTPSPSILRWTPEINSGTFTGQSQGPWNIAANDQYLSYGGEFTIVNNKRQQGLVRFAVKEIAPNKQGPRITAAEFVPNGLGVAAGAIRVNWTTNFDRDNERLVYRLYRDGNTTTPIYETTARSVVWDRPNIGFTDTGLAPGSSHTYRVRATDAYGNTSIGNWVTLTAGTSGTLSNYSKSVLTDASKYWPLGEASGTTVYDWADRDDGTARAGVTRGVTGAIVGDAGKASRFNGSTSGYVSTSRRSIYTNTFTVESWFKTGTALGGKIIGFGNASSGNSTTYDRHVYMDNFGRIHFGVHPGSVQVISSTAAYNDNQWHHVAASLGPNGMALYLDGVLVAQRATVTTGQPYYGYWRIGGDNLGGWPNRPLSNYFAGDIDEAAVYTKVLTPAAIANHYQIAKTGVGSNQPPVADFSAAATDLTVAFDATSSTDSDGTITGYAWSYGDGATGTGSKSSHTYAAAGTYTVKLTVTDDGGATGSVSKQVTVSKSNQAPVAAFTATTSGLSVAVDGRGSSDPDGTIASYAWNFGDGGTATGATATHAYAAGGTYTVTLTVTDNGGATDTESRSVTVSGPGQPAAFARDAFERTVTGGLGSADLGGTWSGASPNLAVNGGAARITAGAGATTSSMLNGATSADTDLQVELALQQAASGGGTYVSVIGRAVAGDDYRARVKVSSTGVVQLQLMRGATTLQALNIPGITYATGDQLQVRLQVFGTSPTTIRGKVWRVGTAEPPAWQLSTTDATAALQAAGGLGLSLYVSGSATVVPLTVAFDDLVAQPTG